MSEIAQGLILVHAPVTWALTGVIWLVQLVHYPLFARVGEAGFRRYEQEHVRRIGWVVAPLMLVEAATGLMLALSPPAGAPPVLAWAGLALLAVIWLSTAFLQVPRHRRLEAGFDREAHAELVRGNWLRTVAWTLRAVLVSAILAMSF